MKDCINARELARISGQLAVESSRLHHAALELGRIAGVNVEWFNETADTVLRCANDLLKMIPSETSSDVQPGQ